MGWVAVLLWVIGIILAIAIVKKFISSKNQNNFYTPTKMSFADSMRKVGRSIGECCRKLGA